jgi:carboxylate-amine ligase
MLEQVLDDVHRDAEVLDCVEEIEHCRSIVGSGTSADTQLAVFEKAQGRSEDRDRALRAVTDWLAEATLQ